MESFDLCLVDEFQMFGDVSPHYSFDNHVIATSLEDMTELKEFTTFTLSASLRSTTENIKYVQASIPARIHSFPLVAAHNLSYKEPEVKRIHSNESVNECVKCISNLYHENPNVSILVTTYQHLFLLSLICDDLVRQNIPHRMSIHEAYNDESIVWKGTHDAPIILGGYIHVNGIEVETVIHLQSNRKKNMVSHVLSLSRATTRIYIFELNAMFTRNMKLLPPNIPKDRTFIGPAYQYVPCYEEIKCYLDEVGHKLVGIVKAIQYCPKVSRNILVRCYKRVGEEGIIYLPKSIKQYFKFQYVTYERRREINASYGYNGSYDQFIMIIDVNSSNISKYIFHHCEQLHVLLPHKVIVCKRRPMESVEL